MVEFDSEFFDRSSEAWLNNKIRRGASYQYRCTYIHQSGKRCRKTIIILNFASAFYYP